MFDSAEQIRFKKWVTLGVLVERFTDCLHWLWGIVKPSSLKKKMRVRLQVATDSATGLKVYLRSSYGQHHFVTSSYHSWLPVEIMQSIRCGLTIYKNLSLSRVPYIECMDFTSYVSLWHGLFFLISLQIEKVHSLNHLNKIEGVLDDKSGRTFILVCLPYFIQFSPFYYLTSRIKSFETCLDKVS